MGRLLRRYWHPIAASAELDANPLRTKEVRLLGENLVLYRDRGGSLGLLDRYCPHRRVNLAMGVVEDDGLRCAYHGWKFDRRGRCVEQPFEDTLDPSGSFRSKCGIKSYPAQELGGLVWAYLGPEPVPLLPRWGPLVWENAVRDLAIAELPCNWLQCQENSPDPVHTEWLHTYTADYYRRVYNSNDGTDFRGLGPTAGRRHMRIRFEDFEHGLIKARMVEGDTGEEEDWTIGHPCIFPHGLLTGCQWAYTMQFRVPVDDTNTYHISLYVFPGAPNTTTPRQQSVPYRYVPLRDEAGRWRMAHSFAQDYMAWVEQGAIAERHLEKLGKSDEGIIRYRRMLVEAIADVEAGRDPMNVLRDPHKNVCIELPCERVKHRLRTRPIYKPAEGELATIAGDFGYSVDAELIEQALATWDTIPEYARS
ncbi:MAG: aromatic ring-hydroxylating dioxygenase subunit alpha [Myxococcota bacterium]